MNMKTYVQAYLLQCLYSQKTGYQSRCLAIEDQLNKLHFIHAMITSFRRIGETSRYWYLDWSPTYIVNCKKRGAQACLADWFQLPILSHSPLLSVPSLVLGDQPLWIASWVPRSSGGWLCLASGNLQHGIRGKEGKVCVLIPFLPWISGITPFPLEQCFLLSSSNHSFFSFLWALGIEQLHCFCPVLLS